MGQYINTERDGRVAVVTIDNPPMNALSAALLEELEAEIDALDADDEVRAIVLRGGGERAFVAGADIKEFPSLRESPPAGGRLGARHPEARRPHGRGAHAVRRRDPGLLPRRRPRAGDVLRHPRRRGGRAARAAGDQARPHPRRRRHAAAAAARRPGPRAAAQPDRRLHRRRDGRRLGPRRARGPEGRAASRPRSAIATHDRRPVAGRRWPSSASSRARRATCRSRRA